MNQLMKERRDPELVKQRLGEIRALNERAANIKMNEINNIRTNYGQEPIDGFGNVEPVYGRGASQLEGNQTAEQVRAAYQAGKITREQARAQLQQLGGQ
jgi:hypothetical protein